MEGARAALAAGAATTALGLAKPAQPAHPDSSCFDRSDHERCRPLATIARLPLPRLPQALSLLAIIGLVAACSGVSGSDPSAQASVADVSEGPEFPMQNRPDVQGTTGAVSSGHPLATAVGHDVLRRGGNATDAVVAMAAVLAVVRPNMNGIGGDAFAIFYDGESGAVQGMNGSGRTGALADPSFFLDAGDTEIPQNGPRSVSVPGTVAAWSDALERSGTWTLADALRPAIRYAREGFPVSWRLRADIEAQGDHLNEAGQAQYRPGGAPPPLGARLRNPALAETLERIARSGKAGFYEGPVADRLAAFLEAEGGYLRAPDLAAHETTWVEPLSGGYLGHQILVLPPNTQGFAQLQQMAMAAHFDLPSMGFGTADYLHTLIEIKKLAFADRDLWASDPEFTDIPLERLLDPEYLADRADDVDLERAAEDVAPGVRALVSDASSTAGTVRVADAGSALDPGSAETDDSGDTVYLTAVDQWGNAVSWIQSLFAGFGSGLFEPETGVMLHNRGALFTLEEGHPNQVAPGKRPYHTLTPMMGLREDGSFAFTMGTPGGDSQTQSLLAIVNNLLLFGMSPQEAIEAPRYRSYSSLRVDVEDRVSADVRAELIRRGHDVRVVHGWTATFGGAQMILARPEHGTLSVASDPRREAYGLAY